MKNIIAVFLFTLSLSVMAQDNHICQHQPDDAVTNLSGDNVLIQEVLNSGFENCDLNYRHATENLGAIGVCQNSSDETRFRFQTSQTNTSIRTCLIPTYKDETGNSTYLGQPQCTYTESGKVLTGKLYKDRKDFAKYPVNGVMVMKEPILAEYFNCMDSYATYLQKNCAEKKNGTSCVKAARNYQKEVCGEFKRKHYSNYLDLKLR